MVSLTRCRFAYRTGCPINPAQGQGRDKRASRLIVRGLLPLLGFRSPNSDSEAPHL